MCNFYQLALILRSYCSLEVDDDFDAPQLMDEDVFYDDNGASDNYCIGNGGENEVKLFKTKLILGKHIFFVASWKLPQASVSKEEYKFVSIFCLD